MEHAYNPKHRSGDYRSEDQGILNCKGTLGLLKTQETLSQKLHEINKKNTRLLEVPTSPQDQSVVTLAT